MRKQAMPGEDPLSLPAPEDFAAALMELVADGLIWSGEIFDFRGGRLVIREHPG
jgi:hypothetical protein